MRIMHMSRAAETLRWFLIPTMVSQKKLGHYVCICTSEMSDACVGSGVTPDAAYLRNVGFEVFPTGLTRSINPVSILKAIMRVKRILKEKRIEVIICHNPLGAAVGRIAANLVGLPYIIYFAHGLACAPAQGAISWRLRYWAEKLLGYFTDAILVMNDYDENLRRNRHIIKNTDKIFRIPGMGVDLSQYSFEDSGEVKHKLAKELSIDKERKIVLSVARLIPEKGVFLFLEAAKRICAQRDDVCFLLAGGGPSMDKLRKIVEINNLEATFKLLGWRNDVYRLMQAADIFALPTYYNEGLPVSILEAMACGKPVIATQHRGCEDAVVDAETGFLVPTKQVAALIEKILFLLDDEQLRVQMGQAGRQRIENNFELSHCTNEIIEALEKAIR